VLAISVHHFSRNKQRDGWIKEGKPGRQDIDYIFWFTRRDLATLVTEPTIRGVGFYRVTSLPFWGPRLQNAMARLLGWAAALTGYGYMLVAEKRIQRILWKNLTN
jgi:hypothetical protein